MTTTAIHSVGRDLGAPIPATPHRLLVTHRDPETKTYGPLGFLQRTSEGFRFDYIREAVERADFRHLPGLPPGDGPNFSTHLIPLFASRVMAYGRPDRSSALAALALGPDAEPFEVLARSGGRRVGDAVELIPVPEPDDHGNLALLFFAHGVRYRDDAEQARIARLVPGEALRLQEDKTNPIDSHAVLVTDEGCMKLGYVPAPLLSLVADLSDRRLEVVRGNGPEVGFHFRLLVQLRGRLVPGRRPFDGPAYRTV